MSPDDLIDAARERTGLEEFDSESFREGLEVLIAGMQNRNDYTERGRAGLAADFGRHLDNRLRVSDYLRRHPEVLEAPIEAPIVIMGMPRTGTTVISYLLDCDPRWRSLLNWEAVDSVPPPTMETLRSDPRCIEKKRAQEKSLAAMTFSPPHWEWADGPTECIFVHSQDFKALAWEAMAPSREYAEFMLTCDMSTAYEYQKKVLRILQSKAPGRWALKMPSHSLHIKAVLGAFPDARLIWAHRSPYKALVSLCNMIAGVHSGVLTEVDRQYIHDVYPYQLGEHVRRPMAIREGLPAEQMHDVFWTEFLRDPIVEMRRIYHWLGEELEPEVEQKMHLWLQNDAERQSRRPPYRFVLEDFGLTKQAVARNFEEYLERYPTAPEA